ncbi:putative sin3 complex subunit [Phaeomoniella chlamydospora]|uniref:Putative sin3 complex subunit n=1 Tax=Phaeomoniella chlamydospora TaxID=158046 RepID=A0A0G2H1W8_PHACM|nr:putative sin3 complex subunit [Phaeomoniella chlamydospora]
MRRLQGYEMYLVEQWACSRTHPTFMIAVYTGDMSQSILVGVLSVPTDESSWSSRLKVYFQAVQQFHARKKETPLGTIMVTNLSSFPSALTVISVPDGEIKKHREDFIVNEDLKRMGCLGRAGMNLQSPPPSAQAKFFHIYHISEKVPLYTAVMDLVKLCQLALVIFDKLKLAFADGLLCDVTESALTDWWSDIGTDMFNLEPNDGILGPTTVSALVGLLVGSHNRLKAFGAPVAKDPFEVDATKRALSYFQKTQKLPRTRRLDRQTVEKLQRVTAKAASGEGWTVPRAVKSTVAELSGKGGDMVMGMVGGSREKAGIAEVETLDLERMSQLVTGARARWLWQGKPIKAGTADQNVANNDPKDVVFSSDERGGYVWTTKRRDTGLDRLRSRAASPNVDETSSYPEQRSGLDRLRNRVGMVSGKSHQHQHQYHPLHHLYSRESGIHGEDKGSTQRFNTETNSTLVDREDALISNRQSDPADSLKDSDIDRIEPSIMNDSKQSFGHNATDYLSPDIVISRAEEEERGRSPFRDDGLSLKQSLDREKSPAMDLENYRDVIPIIDTQQPESRYLRRSRSAILLRKIELESGKADRFSRHPSFSMIEGSVLTRNNITDETISIPDTDLVQRMQQHESMSKIRRDLAKKVVFLEKVTLRFTQMNVDVIDDLEEFEQRQTEELSQLYNEKLDEFLTIKTHSKELFNDERGRLEENVRKVDTLGAKLDYELNALESRIEDVEDGITAFEQSIIDIEGRIQNLVKDNTPSGSWFSWLGWSSSRK